MKRFQASVLFTLLVCVSLAVAACGGGATAGSSTGGGPSATTAPTTPPKPKPTAVPKITVAFCQGIMTVAQANQIMHPPTPATTIRVDAPASGGGSCNYEYKPYLSVVSVLFLPYTGGPGNEQTMLTSAAAKLATVKTAKVTTTQVSGVGDAAMFVTVVLASPPLNEAGLDVIYGSLFIGCDNFKVQGSSFATQQTYLTQVCQQFIAQI